VRPALARIVPVVALTGVLAGCGSDAADDVGPERCDVPFTVPDGFEATGGIEDPYKDRVGVRVDMEADGGRELHFFAGIPGEFGEGLPLAGSLPVADGGEGALLGDDDVWVFVVHGEGCSQTAVLGSGLDRRDFVGVLREVGAVVE
jgi:hypothetical protein